MKKIQSKKDKASALYEYNGYLLWKWHGHWYAVLGHVSYITADGPTDTRAELVKAIDNNEIYEW